MEIITEVGTFEDFKKFAKDKVNTRVTDMTYPTIIEEREAAMRMTEMNVFSRLIQERILFLSGQVKDNSMDTLTAQMLYLDSIDNRPISLYINSGGGDCYSGMQLIGVMDFINSEVNTVVLGLAASMAAVIASNGTKGKRMALPYSRFMIHQPSGYQGWSTYKDSRIDLEELETVKTDLYEILAKNSGNSFEQIEQMCDRDKWMKPTEAIAKGFLDAIIEPNQHKQS